MSERGKRRAKSSAQGGAAGGRSKRVCVGHSSEHHSPVSQEVREEVERLYQLRMPEDFYHFWDFCQRLNPERPQDALQDTLGLHLVGPFDVLSGKHRSCRSSQPNFHLHWRYFYDPPEFQTLLRGEAETQHHLGYFRDSPKDLPVFVGENEAKKNCVISPVGENLFAAVLLFLGKKEKGAGGRKEQAGVCDLKKALRQEAERLGLPLDSRTKAIRDRDKKVVTKTFHRAGIVVPVEDDVGYRELPESDSALKTICKAIDMAADDNERMKAFAPLQSMMTCVQFANDECDYGMGYELGIDLFCYGSRYLYKMIGQLLPMAYRLLGRDIFGEIIQAHLANRSHDDLDQMTRH